jgi:site-specific recombinase
MTAATIAQTMHEGDADREALVTVMARLVRSQIAAAMGNVVTVGDTAWAIDLWWTARHGAPFLTEDYAHGVLSALHPTRSGTIGFAMYTGLALWVSSLCAGALENWAVYRRLPEAIAEHRVRRIVGARATGWASRVFARNIAGIGGNVSIGLMLGMTTVIGRFVGVPIDVRHITLSTGQTVFALRSLGASALATPEARYALLGLLCVLVLNLGVSFVLAIVVAMRAREVGFGTALRLFADMFVGFVRSPLRFFLPVERVSEADRAAH